MELNYFRIEVNLVTSCEKQHKLEILHVYARMATTGRERRIEIVVFLTELNSHRLSKQTSKNNNSNGLRFLQSICPTLKVNFFEWG